MSKCIICEKEFKNDHALKSHIGLKHPKDKVQSNDEKVVEVKPEVEKLEEISLGSSILLDGMVFKQNGDGWDSKKVSNVAVSVTAVSSRKEGNVNDRWLICYEEAESVYYSVLEKEVISGLVGKVVPKVQETPRNESMFKKFKDAVKEFIGIRDRKLETEKLLKKVQASTRPIIEGYVRENGKESESGKGDFLVTVDVDGIDYKTHLVKIPGRIGVDRNEQGIVDWLLKNGWVDCLKQSLDVDKWEALKRLGKVPSEVISQNEKPTEIPDSFRLDILPSKKSD